MIKKIVVFSLIVYACSVLGQALGLNQVLLAIPIIHLGLTIGTVFGILFGFVTAVKL